MTRPLDLWTDGATRSAIVDFVRLIGEPGPGFVPVEHRVAVFDNDGTLWCEKPMPIQLDFTIRRFAELAEAQPELRTRQPYQAAYNTDLHWLGEAMVKHYHGDDADLQLLMQAVSSAFHDITVDEYDATVREFFAAATHPTLHRSYLDCGYAPMVQLLAYLEANGFTCYIASGGDRDFMRPIAEQLYNVPPERVIGSALGLSYHEQNGQTSLMYKAAMDFFDDGPEKPVRIWSRIGRRPILAAGNSNGDIPMLAFAQLDGRPSLRLLVQHDDAEREFADVTGAEDALAAASTQGWTTVSMKNDWATVFNDQR